MVFGVEKVDHNLLVVSPILVVKIVVFVDAGKNHSYGWQIYEPKSKHDHQHPPTRITLCTAILGDSEPPRHIFQVEICSFTLVSVSQDLQG